MLRSFLKGPILKLVNLGSWSDTTNSSVCIMFGRICMIVKYILLQVEKLKNEIELQNRRRHALDARASEAEKKVQELNLKLENVSLDRCIESVGLIYVQCCLMLIILGFVS